MSWKFGIIDPRHPAHAANAGGLRPQLPFHRHLHRRAFGVSRAGHGLL